MKHDYRKHILEYCPLRKELIKKWFDPDKHDWFEQPNRHTHKINTYASKKKRMRPTIMPERGITEDSFKVKFKKKYPFAFDQMQSSGYDMAGWIFRNIKFIKK